MQKDFINKYINLKIEIFLNSNNNPMALNIEQIYIYNINLLENISFYCYFSGIL